jgi:DMSO/TMAO reductase YedYZ molybdopterin-dependent catalytic subunit
VKNWPILDLGVQPDVPTDRWRLDVGGLVETPLSWNWTEFRAQPRFRDVSDMHCVTAWSRFDNHWEGISGRHILSLVKPKPEVRFVIFHGYDGYTTNLPFQAFDDDDVLLAHSWEGKPIAREHGGPVRAIVPKLYLWKSAKWISRIEFSAVDKPGFWEVRGYHRTGDPWTEERYDPDSA